MKKEKKLSDTVNASVVNEPDKVNITKDAVLGLLARGVHNLKRGLKALDCNLIITKQPLDILAVDILGQLTIIELEPEEEEAIILRALQHFDWILHNINSVVHKYNKEKIDITVAPRIILVSKNFSEEFINKLTYINATDIELYEYELNNDEGISSLKFRPRVFNLAEHKTIDMNRPRPEDLINSIKILSLKQLCCRIIKECTGSLKDTVVDASMGYIEIKKESKRLMGIYPQPAFFWMSFNASGVWDGVKIEEGLLPEDVLTMVRQKINLPA